ncbi:MAG: amino acid adenylation domain-containing protein [Hespellia sp.]|nr:amino acid adenylation domain-containing protein [Hespellia sp.]
MKNVLEYLENSAEKYPDKIAVADEKKQCTFSELLSTARKIGSAVAKHTQARQPIPVLMEKGVDELNIFLGIVHAGCFYVALDPKHPIVRIQQILDTLDARVLITNEECSELAEKLEFAGKILSEEELTSSEEDACLLWERRRQAADIDPLYTNFTSGSTGKPKGVIVSHRSVLDFIDEFVPLFGITQEDVIGNQAPFDFDVSVKDIYSALKAGATLQIIPKKLFSFPTKLLDFLEERKITTLIWAVSALCIITTLKGFEYKVPSFVKKVLFSGEVMPIKHLNLWKKYLPDALYVNLYGPTEITCNCTYYIIKKEFAIGETLPIGIPFANEKVMLLDGDELVTQRNRQGEICVSGTALALGYYNNMEQTRKVFVQNPLNQKYPELMYRTGDLGYYDEDDQICFSSRKDFQIKHMGHRIELGEIEGNIEKIDAIVRVCCIFDEKKSRILAFYEGDIDRKEIVRKISESLPPYMVPNKFYQVDKMPLTNNGKIDRKILMEITER